jgi:nicotinate-nucleotide pyrophosphorylase (carboxylating)
LALERPFLNLVAYASGVASATRQLVDVVARVSSARVTSTRKILPYYRDLAIYGVLCGGGVAHRVSLSGGVLLKENHIAAAGGIARAIKGVQAISPHGLKIEIEVRNLDELKQALKAGAEVVMLDNFEPEKVRAAVKQVRESKRAVVIEVSGGLTAANIAEYALPGVDVLSCGGLTHSVRALDLSLLVFGL